MSDYNYLNARIKSLKKELFSRGKLDELLGLDNLEEIKRFFLESPYGPSVSEALARHPGTLGVERGLSRQVHRTFQNILEWSGACSGGGSFVQAGDEPRRLLELFLRRYDLHNVKTLLRGKNGKLPAESIVESLIPVGTFGMEELSELAKQPTLRDTFVLLSNWHEPLKRVLRKNIGSLKGEPVDLRGLESELDHYYYEGILGSLSEAKGEDAELVRRYIQMEVDITNILTLLRLKEIPRNELGSYLMKGGFLGKGFLFPIAGGLKPAELVQKFESTYLAETLRAWNPKGGLADLERRFALFLLEEIKRAERVDPLSIGVALSYFTQLSHELKRLRIILHGKFFALSEVKLREELQLV